MRYITILHMLRRVLVIILVPNLKRHSFQALRVGRPGANQETSRCRALSSLQISSLCGKAGTLYL